MIREPELAGSLSASLALLVALAGCGESGGGGADAAVAADARADGARWETLAPLERGAVQETAVVELEGKIYVLGGFHETDGEVSDVLVYDPEEDSWGAAAPLPQRVHHVNAAAVGGTIYVVGALSGAGFAAVGVTWEYDPAEDVWNEKTPMPAGSERGSAAVGVVDGVIYVAGGFRGGSAVADVSSYDPVSDEHDLSPEDLPGALDHLVGAAVGDTFYVIGGRDTAIDAVTARVDAYDPEGGGWSPRAPMPTPRGGAAAGVVGGRIVVVGGEGNREDPSGVFPQAEVYDPAPDAWSALPEMPTPRHGMGAAGLENRLYVPGGADTRGFGAIDVHEALVLPAP